jgi:hypothetical protein
MPRDEVFAVLHDRPPRFARVISMSEIEDCQPARRYDRVAARQINPTAGILLQRFSPYCTKPR